MRRRASRSRSSGVRPFRRGFPISSRSSSSRIRRLRGRFAALPAFAAFPAFDRAAVLAGAASPDSATAAPTAASPATSGLAVPVAASGADVGCTARARFDFFFAGFASAVSAAASGRSACASTGGSAALAALAPFRARVGLSAFVAAAAVPAGAAFFADADFGAAFRAADLRPADVAAVFFAAVFFEAFRVGAFFAAVFFTAAFFAAVFFGGVFASALVAVFFTAPRCVAVFAPFFVVFVAAFEVFFAAAFLAGAFFAAGVFVAFFPVPDFADFEIFEARVAVFRPPDPRPVAFVPSFAFASAAFFVDFFTALLVPALPEPALRPLRRLVGDRPAAPPPPLPFVPFRVPLRPAERAVFFDDRLRTDADFRAPDVRFDAFFAVAFCAVARFAEAFLADAFFADDFFVAAFPVVVFADAFFVPVFRAVDFPAAVFFVPPLRPAACFAVPFFDAFFVAAPLRLAVPPRPAPALRPDFRVAASRSMASRASIVRAGPDRGGSRPSDVSPDIGDSVFVPRAWAAIITSSGQVVPRRRWPGGGPRRRATGARRSGRSTRQLDPGAAKHMAAAPHKGRTDRSERR